jgi:hypothetical protein
MSDVNQVLNKLKEAVSGQYYGTIIKTLCALRTKKKFRHLSDSEFFDIVGETFKLDPDYFMRAIFIPFRNKIDIIIGSSRRKEMEDYIIRNFCFYEGEQILYKCEGTISNTEIGNWDKSGKYKSAYSVLALYKGSNPIKVSVKSARLIFTNFRIIAQGKLHVRGGQERELTIWGILGGDLSYMFSGGSKRAESKKNLIKSSEIPLYGYNFQIVRKVIRLSRSIMYRIIINDRNCEISIKPKYPSHLDKIFEILCKDASLDLGFCQQCGKPNPDTSKFCSECGKSLQ